MLLLIGHNDTAYLTSGWHPAQEGPAGLPCRWMSQRASFSVPAPAASVDDPASPGSQEAHADQDRMGKMTVCITVSAPATIRGHKPGLSLYAGDRLLGHCADLGPEGHWATSIYELPSPLQGDKSLTLTLAVENRAAASPIPLAFVPHETLHNSDLRELGVLISSIRIA